MQSAPSTCTQQPYQPVYNITLGSPVSNYTMCKSIFTAYGTCANQTGLNTSMTNVTALFRFNSVNTMQYIRMLTNVTMYWKARNGFVNGPITADNTILNSVSKTWNNDSAWRANIPNWLWDVQSTAAKNVQACHEVYANISMGVWCAMAANVSLTYTLNNGAMNTIIPYNFSTSDTEILAKLDVCQPLFDVYCINTFGVSTSRADLPLNNTFDFSVGSIPINVCYAMRNLTNLTDAQSIAQRRNILLSMYNTNRIVYSPDFGTLQAFANFLITGNTTWSYSSKIPTLVQSGAYVSYNPTSPNLTFYSIGQNSGVSGFVYGDLGVGSLHAGVVVLLAAIWVTW